MREAKVEKSESIRPKFTKCFNRGQIFHLISLFTSVFFLGMLTVAVFELEHKSVVLWNWLLGMPLFFLLSFLGIYFKKKDAIENEPAGGA